jgi:hypothetical protein
MKDKNLRPVYLHKFIFVSVTVVNIFALVPCFQFLYFFCCLAQLDVYFCIDASVLGNFLVNYITISFSSNIMCHEVSWLVASSMNKSAYPLEDHISNWISL